jgi:antitoxin FitA
MGREDPQFNFRMTPEIKEKLKQRASMNGRSLNAELLQIVQDALANPTPIMGYRDDAERLADQQSNVVKDLVFETLKKLYSAKS